jgi:hypothetical protein
MEDEREKSKIIARKNKEKRHKSNKLTLFK